MPVRCLENRVWAVTANRIGTEQRMQGQALTFIGTSQIAGPDGSVCLRAPEADEALMAMDVDVARARDKAINPYNNLFEDRRPEMYKS